MANYRRRRWRESMAVHLDLNGLLAATVGADGVAPEDLATLEPALGRVRAELAARRATGGLEFADLPYRRDDVRRVIEVATAARGEFDTLVVLGIGGRPSARAPSVRRSPGKPPVSTSSSPTRSTPRPSGR